MKVTCKYCGIVNKPHKCPHNKRKADRNRIDNKIYESKEYRSLRAEVLEDFNYTCLWSLYVDGKVIEGDRTHHIIEIVQDESKAVEYDNLISLNNKAHEEVHRLYKEGLGIKESIQDLLLNMNESYKTGDKTLGKYRKQIKNIYPPYVSIF
ncbi:MAG: hypothetical protein E7213_05050 [Clostridium sp.]|nr:hypothetical protein [Clostridium sp.]